MSGLHFLAPLALTALVPLAGIIILLYLLKLRRREVVVPSVFLWRRAVQDMQANSPFQRLQRNLLLLLQLLALFALISGLAAPFVLASRFGGKSVVIVLDASASMRATDVKPSRFDEAKQRAIQIAGGMGRHDEAALIVCAARAWVAVPFTSDHRRLAATIRDEHPTDDPTNMRDALLLAFSIAGKRPRSLVYIVSDGSYPPLPEVNTTAEIRFLRVGKRNNNVAILAFEAARAKDGNGHELFLRLKNYASKPKQVTFSFYQENDLIDARRLTLKPEENHSQTYRLILKKPGLLRAEIETDDDLASDNVAYAFADPSATTSILLVTPGNLFLEQALLVLPGTSLYKTSLLSGKEAEEAYRQYAAVIFDRVPPPKPPTSGGVMLIDVDNPAAALGPEVASPIIDHWSERHPVLRSVNLSVVRMEKAHQLRPGPGATSIADAGGKALVVAQERPGLRMVSFGWNLLDSDLPLRVGFPVLLGNAVNWLSQSGGTGADRRARPGSIVSLSAPEVRTVEVTLPDKTRRTVSVTAGQASFAESDQVGVYEMRAGARKQRWAVDLRSAEESNLAPSDEIKLGARSVRAGTGPPKTEQHIWPYLALAALVLLLAEWRLYHRRY